MAHSPFQQQGMLGNEVRCGGCEQELAAVAEQPLNETQSQQNHHKRCLSIVNWKCEQFIHIHNPSLLGWLWWQDFY
jgi:hypothetical protein